MHVYQLTAASAWNTVSQLSPWLASCLASGGLFPTTLGKIIILTPHLRLSPRPCYVVSFPLLWQNTWDNEHIRRKSFVWGHGFRSFGPWSFDRIARGLCLHSVSWQACWWKRLKPRNPSEPWFWINERQGL
jgi:hypothetical protein